jgi:serine/threonine protein kinase
MGCTAPEVLNKQKYGTSADIWSLGITIYELLERQRPFASPEESLTQERVHFHHQGVTREAKDLIRGVHRHLVDRCRTLLSIWLILLCVDTM